jgi:hypothetical protein
MSWNQYSQTPPVIGQGFSPGDLILAAWPQTETTAPLVAVMSIDTMIGMQTLINPPTYWQPIDSSLPPYSPPLLSTPALETYLQQQIAQAQTAGGNPATLQAILAAIKPSAVTG